MRDPEPIQPGGPNEWKAPVPALVWVLVGLLPLVPIIAVEGKNFNTINHLGLREFCLVYLNGILSYAAGYGLIARNNRNIMIRALAGLILGVGFFIFNVVMVTFAGCVCSGKSL